MGARHVSFERRSQVGLLALLGALSGPALAGGHAAVSTSPADAAAKAPCPEGTRRVDRILRDARGTPRERELTCEDGKGRRQGLYERFWLDARGTKSAEGHYQDGQRVGAWLTFWDNGFKAEEGQYESGRRTGRWSYWHSNGRRAAEGRYERDLRDGRWSAYDPSGKLLRHAEYLKGRRVQGEEVAERGEAVEGPGSWDEDEDERREPVRAPAKAEHRESEAKEAGWRR